MPPFLSGPGLGLQLPQNLYPSQLQNAPNDINSNRVVLAAGDALVLPAGDWYIQTGPYCILQFLDPLTSTWLSGPTPGWQGGNEHITSDGFNVRVANMTACPIGAVVVASSGSYVQATTTVAATAGGALGAASTWAPIVGGALSMSGATLIANGAGYGIAPMVLIPPPPPASSNPNGIGGIAAEAYAVLSSGTVAGISFICVGAGYPTAPAAVIVPNPTDPNITTGITNASVNLALGNAGSITGVICTNFGSPLRTISTFSLAVTGAGTGCTLTPLVMSTVTAASVAGLGGGYGTVPALVTSVGGFPPTTSAFTDPTVLLTSYRPRPATISLTPANTSVSVGTLGVVYDGGLFLHAPGTPPTPIVIPGNGASVLTTIASVVFTMGSVNDYCILQPAP